LANIKRTSASRAEGAAGAAPAAVVVGAVVVLLPRPLRGAELAEVAGCLGPRLPPLLQVLRPLPHLLLLLLPHLLVGYSAKVVDWPRAEGAAGAAPAAVVVGAVVVLLPRPLRGAELAPLGGGLFGASAPSTAPGTAATAAPATTTAAAPTGVGAVVVLLPRPLRGAELAEVAG
jgi:hypothetical protein